jgi:hypothetical protein
LGIGKKEREDEGEERRGWTGYKKELAVPVSSSDLTESRTGRIH